MIRPLPIASALAGILTIAACSLREEANQSATAEPVAATTDTGSVIHAEVRPRRQWRLTDTDPATARDADQPGYAASLAASAAWRIHISA